MPISITHTMPMLGIQIQKAKFEISNNFVIDFKVSHTEPQIQIHSTQSTLHIDQTKAFGDEGLKNIQALAEQFTQDAQQAVLKYISKMNSEGNRLGDIKAGGSPIAEIARDNSFQQKQFGLGIMPEHGPEIQVDQGKVEFELQRGEVNTQYNYVPIETQYMPPQIRYYMIQNGDLQISYTGNNVDTKI